MRYKRITRQEFSIDVNRDGLSASAAALGEIAGVDPDVYDQSKRSCSRYYDVSGARRIRLSDHPWGQSCRQFDCPIGFESDPVIVSKLEAWLSQPTLPEFFPLDFEEEFSQATEQYVAWLYRTHSRDFARFHSGQELTLDADLPVSPLRDMPDVGGWDGPALQMCEMWCYWVHKEEVGRIARNMAFDPAAPLPDFLAIARRRACHAQ